MAVPANPNSQVSVAISFTVIDLISGGTVTINRAESPVNLKTLNVQYGGLVNLPGNTSFQFTPSPSASVFSFFYVRNAGTPTGTANVQCQFQASGAATVNTMILDVGAILLYISPSLSSIPFGAVSPGVNSIIITTPVGSNSANIEVYAAT